MLHVLISFPPIHPTLLTLGAIITFLLTVAAIAVVVALMGIMVGLIERRHMQKLSQREKPGQAVQSSERGEKSRKLVAEEEKKGPLARISSHLIETLLLI